MPEPMTLLRLLNLLFFGPKVTAPKINFSSEGKRLKRDWRIVTLDAGSCQADNLEIQALSNAYYDFERFGFSFVTSPRHADILLVTGPVTSNMSNVVLATHTATPKPCLVVAVGDGACDGGIWKNSYAVVGPVEALIPVNLRIPGNPPSPTTILQALIGLCH